MHANPNPGVTLLLPLTLGWARAMHAAVSHHAVDDVRCDERIAYGVRVGVI